MDYKELKSQLDICINKEGDFYQEVQRKICDFPEKIKELAKPALLSQPIVKVLNQLEFYSASEGGRFIKTGTGGYGFHPSIVAERLVSKALENNSSQSAIDWFNKVINTKSANGYFVVLLWGVNINESIDLYDGIKLVPLSELPSSKNNDWACEDINWGPREIYSTWLGKPECALVKKVTVEPVIYHISNGDSFEKKKNLMDYLTLEKEIGLVLSIIGPSPLMEAMNWFNYEDEELDYAQFYGSRAWHHYEIMPSMLLKFGQFKPEIAKEVVSAFYEISDQKTKKRIVNSITRLNQAMRRADAGNSAVELSIALECLFASGNGGYAHKIGLRIAFLIGENFDHKKRMKAIISSIYNVRSAVVHNGEASSPIKINGYNEKLSLEDLIKEGCEICAKAISKIILMKSLPNWDEFELSGGKID